VALINTYSPQSENPSFILISYNIRLNTQKDGINAWPFRKEKVASLLRFHEADIFCVQEALCDQMEDLKTFFPGFDSYGVGRDDGIHQGEHIAVFYRRNRFDCISSGTFWLCETPEIPEFGWDAGCKRTVTWLRLKDSLSSRQLFVFNTHFDNNGIIARTESAKLVLTKIEEINQEQLPLMLTGDFNMVKSEEPIQTILGKLNDALYKSLTPPYGPEGTSRGFDVKEMPKKIDYIFVNDKVTVLKHGVLSDSFGLYYPSDHLPVLAEIKL